MPKKDEKREAKRDSIRRDTTTGNKKNNKTRKRKARRIRKNGKLRKKGKVIFGTEIDKEYHST